MSNWRNWEGNRAMVLTREFEAAHPFGEIYPPRITDANGRDALQSMLEVGAGRYDTERHVAKHLRRSMELRQEIQQVPLSAGDEGNTPAGTAGKSGNDTVAVRPSLMAGKP